MKNLIEIEDLENSVAPAGVGGSVVIEIIFVIIFLNRQAIRVEP